MNESLKEKMIRELVLAHHNATLNNKGNIGGVAVLNAYQGSGSLHQALASGVLAMGGIHAPLTAARKLIRRFVKHGVQHFDMHLITELANNRKIPGFGHSFYKDRVDPAFYDVYTLHEAQFLSTSPISEIRDRIHKAYQDRGRDNIYLPPNAAIITAAVCEFLQLEEGFEVAIALEGRISAWVRLINQGGWRQ